MLFLLAMIIYTDGSYRSTTKKGAYGIWIVEDGKEPKGHVGVELNTTNNVMEMMAVKLALSHILVNDIDPKTVQIVCDSQYVVKGLTEWYQTWAVRGFKGYNGKPILNLELWKELAALYNKVKCEIKWEKGHANCAGNNRIDEIVNTATKKALEN